MPSTRRARSRGDFRRMATVATAWCFPICRAARRWGAPSTRLLQHAMEAGEWAQAIPAPRPRLLETLRDDPDVKAALADGAVLAVVPLVFNSGKGVKADISLDAGTLQAIDEGAAAHGLTRSAFMASAALEKIRRGT